MKNILSNCQIASSLAFATALSGSLTLAGCSTQDTKSGFYHSVAECVKDGIYTQKYCQEGFDKAQAENAQVAPKYHTLNDCNTDWDTCVPANSNSSNSSSDFFIPYMMGYWMGSTTTHPFSGNSYQTSFYYPLYTDRNGTTISPSTQQQFNGFSKVGAARTTINPDFSTAQSVKAAGPQVFSKGNSATSLGITRGGFGSTASRPSSFGGSYGSSTGFRTSSSFSAGG